LGELLGDGWLPFEVRAHAFVCRVQGRPVEDRLIRLEAAAARTALPETEAEEAPVAEQDDVGGLPDYLDFEDLVGLGLEEETAVKLLHAYGQDAIEAERAAEWLEMLRREAGAATPDPALAQAKRLLAEGLPGGPNS
jgi:hypothetical protein